MGSRIFTGPTIDDYSEGGIDDDMDFDGPLGGSLSDSHWSHDAQVKHVMDYLAQDYPDAYREILADYPEWEHLTWEDEYGNWVDTETSGVPFEYTSWVADAIENTGLVSWWEGEPWMTFPDEERDCQIHGHAWEDTKSYTLSGGNPHYKCRFCRTIFIDMD